MVFKIGNVSVSGTFDLKDIADILRKHKEGSLSTGDAVWEFIQRSK